MRRFIIDFVRRLVGVPILLDLVQSTGTQLEEVKAQLASLIRRQEEEKGALDEIRHVSSHSRDMLVENARLRELYYRDLMLGVDRTAKLFPPAEVTIQTDQPIAVDSDDHKFPWGTVNDNSRQPRFVATCERYFGRPLTAIDLGCAGGGLVLDFIFAGHKAYGVEGSDVSLLAKRAEWRTLPNNLFTADITKPFELRDAAGTTVSADVLTMWEVLEHIEASDLPQLFANIRHHLKPDGLFVGSVALRPDDAPWGAHYHRTVQTLDWWKDQFAHFGMRMIEGPFAFDDFVRGTGNGYFDPNFRTNPEAGAHFVAVHEHAPPQAGGKA